MILLQIKLIMIQILLFLDTWSSLCYTENNNSLGGHCFSALDKVIFRLPSRQIIKNCDFIFYNDSYKKGSV